MAGIDMPSIDEPVGGLCPEWPVAAFFDSAFLATTFFVEDLFVSFFAAGFFLAVGFAGIGMVMPGMFMRWAWAGTATDASANALAATKNLEFTDLLQGGVE